MAKTSNNKPSNNGRNRGRKYIEASTLVIGGVLVAFGLCDAMIDCLPHIEAAKVLLLGGGLVGITNGINLFGGKGQGQ